MSVFDALLNGTFLSGFPFIESEFTGSQSFAMDPCSSPRAVRREGAEKSCCLGLICLFNLSFLLGPSSASEDVASIQDHGSQKV